MPLDQRLTQAYAYRIDGIPDVPDAGYARWHFIGSLDGVARFLDPRARAVHLVLDRLTEVARGHLMHKPD